MTDWLPELADDDLEVLLEALEAWEHKDVAGDLAGAWIDAMLTKSAGPPPADIAERRRRDEAKRAQQQHWRKERSVLLRAKLIVIRDRRHSERMTQDALNR
jgi:hypothetical protein